MRNLIIRITLGLSVLSLVFFSSCKNDDGAAPIDPPDYSIQSTERFEVVETHENGWIKHAVRYNYNNEPMYAFSYYANGYLKEVSMYRDYPYSLWYEHQRTEDNLPASTKYYDVQGNLYAELFFEQGIKTKKVVYFGDETTTFLYEAGEMLSTEKVNTSRNTRTLVSRELNGTASLRYFVDDVLNHEGTLYETDLGSGYSADDDMPLLQPLDEAIEVGRSPMRRSAFSSVSEYYKVLPQDFIEYPAAYDFSDDALERALGGRQGYHDMKAVLNSDLFRELSEQYPFTEGTVLVSDISYIEDQVSVSNGWIPVHEAAEEKKQRFAEDFDPIFGGEYVSRVFTGKAMVTVGTVRNLPTDQALRDELKLLARRHVRAILQNETPLLPAEQEKLANVFLEIRAHSDVLDAPNGIVITSYEQYSNLVDAFNNAGMVEVQRQFTEY